MNILAEIGTKDLSIPYIDRPTVKVLIHDHEDKILVINEGLLPGGGVDTNEDRLQALERELREELGAKVSQIEEIGTVIQYRDFLKKRYIINGYTAHIEEFDGSTNPQDEGEKQFEFQWYTRGEALNLVVEAVQKFDGVPILDDSQQGKLFNLMTTQKFLELY